ncbi:hypothetical protein [Paludibacterium denitrificans]|uniref:Uncharacterized protein n=1 Tax=Paludibacterium denitrificans TaxID=2675226 RepID=A0A844GFF7_9NEIS|nr:hypothetical protein [Paludibacterium denitrificans]MTD33424.1 hypothetical protein [Paludibacterium denitrificans]
MTTFSYTYIPPKAVLSNLESAQSTYDAVKVAGGYNPTTNMFTPLKLDDKDIIFQGGNRPQVPAGRSSRPSPPQWKLSIVDTEMWPTQLFADYESFKTFVSVLDDYEVCYKLIDPGGTHYVR